MHTTKQYLFSPWFLHDGLVKNHPLLVVLERYQKLPKRSASCIGEISPLYVLTMESRYGNKPSLALTTFCFEDKNMANK